MLKVCNLRLIITSRNSKFDCFYCTVHFTKQKIGTPNVLTLIRMLTILFCVAKEIFWCIFPLSFKDLMGDIMTSKRDLRFFFFKTDNTNKEKSSSSQKVSLIIQSSSNITSETKIRYVRQEIKKHVAKPAKH